MDIHYGRKRSGIKKELNRVIGSWLDSITDDKARAAALDDAIITGGAIASMLLGEEVNDFDIYFRTRSTALIMANYYVDKFNKTVKAGGVRPEVTTETLANIKGVFEDRVCIFIPSDGVAGDGKTEEHTATKDKPEQDKGDKYRPIFMSQNAITLSHKVQVIIRFYGEPNEIHDNFDFIHASCFFDYANKSLVFPSEAMEALLSRTLVYRGSLYPIASIFRAKKFIERGWRITAGQLLKIMWQISEIDMTDIAVLREQLTGVDLTYMQGLIDALSDVDPEKINSTYVAEVIDRIFE